MSVKNLFDCLEKGYAVREFLENFSAVSEQQVSSLLKGTTDRTR